MEGKVFTEVGSKPQFQWEDPFFLDAQLTDEERMVRVLLALLPVMY